MTKRPDLPYLWRTGPYTYFRKAGCLVRLPDPSADGFLAAYDAARRGTPRATGKTTVAEMISSYKLSAAWAERASRTREDYDGIFVYLIEKVGARDVSWFTTPRIVEMMQALHARGQTTKANVARAVLSTLYGHARLIGWTQNNPARGIPPLKIPKDRRKPHVPWTDEAVEKWRRWARPELRLVFELGVGSVQRPVDLLRVMWSDYDGANLHIRSTKTGQEGLVPCTPELKAALDAAPRTGERVLPYANYSAMWRAMRRERERLGTVEHDLHALRYRGIMELAWAGCTDDEIASMSLHLSKQMVAKYAGIARQVVRARQAAEKREQNRTRT